MAPEAKTTKSRRNVKARQAYESETQDKSGAAGKTAKGGRCPEESQGRCPEESQGGCPEQDTGKQPPGAPALSTTDMESVVAAVLAKLNSRERHAPPSPRKREAKPGPSQKRARQESSSSESGGSSHEFDSDSDMCSEDSDGHEPEEIGNFEDF